MTDYLDHLCVASSRAAALALFPHLTAADFDMATLAVMLDISPQIAGTRYPIGS